MIILRKKKIEPPVVEQVSVTPVKPSPQIEEPDSKPLGWFLIDKDYARGLLTMDGDDRV